MKLNTGYFLRYHRKLDSARCQQSVEVSLRQSRIFEPQHEKNLLYMDNKDADQPAHLRSLISTFVVHCFDSIIPILAKSKIL